MFRLSYRAPTKRILQQLLLMAVIVIAAELYAFVALSSGALQIAIAVLWALAGGAVIGATTVVQRVRSRISVDYRCVREAVVTAAESLLDNQAQVTVTGDTGFYVIRRRERWLAITHICISDHLEISDAGTCVVPSPTAVFVWQIDHVVRVTQTATVDSSHHLSIVDEDITLREADIWHFPDLLTYSLDELNELKTALLESSACVS